MRVAFVVPSLGPTEGQGNVDFELLKRVVAAGHEVEVFSSLVPERVHDLGVAVRELPRTGVQFANTWLMIAGSNRALRKQEFDLVHSDGPSTTRKVDVAVCHMPHAAWRRLPRDARREGGLRGMLARTALATGVRLDRRVYTRARRVLVASELSKQTLEATGVDPARIGILPFGIDAAKFRPPTGDERRAARRAFGIAHDEMCVLFVGAQGPRKGLPALLAAMDPRDRLLAIGDRRTGEQERVAQARGLRAMFPGKMDDPRPAYWAADMMIAPSRFDAFGMAILEAMACAVPVVTTRATGAWTVVGEAGIVIADPTDVDGLARAIRELRNDSFARARMGAIGRAIAESRSWDAAGQALLEVYESVLAEKRGHVSVEAA